MGMLDLRHERFLPVFGALNVALAQLHPQLIPVNRSQVAATESKRTVESESWLREAVPAPTPDGSHLLLIVAKRNVISRHRLFEKHLCQEAQAGEAEQKERDAFEIYVGDAPI